MGWDSACLCIGIQYTLSIHPHLHERLEPYSCSERREKRYSIAVNRIGQQYFRIELAAGLVHQPLGRSFATTVPSPFHGSMTQHNSKCHSTQAPRSDYEISITSKSSMER
jgi:hypothetical protein